MIPARPSLPAFLESVVAPPAAPVIGAPAAAAAPLGYEPSQNARRFTLNKPKQFTTADLEAAYRRQLAVQQQRGAGYANYSRQVRPSAAQLPAWLQSMSVPQAGNGILPTLPPMVNPYPLLSSLVGGS